MLENSALVEPHAKLSEFYSLPLSVINGPDGKPYEPDEFLQKMGIQKYLRKQESKLPLNKQLCFRVLDPGFRYIAFIMFLKDTLKPKLGKKLSMISWEFLVFNGIKPMWYKHTAFAEIQDDIDSQRDALVALLDYSALTDAEFKKIGTEENKFIKSEQYCNALFGLYVHISKRTDHWDSLTYKEKVILSEQIWAISLFFKEEIFEELTSRCAGIFDNYPKPEKFLNEENEHSETIEIDSLEDLYIEIDKLVCMGLDEPEKIQYAESITALLAEHLPRLRERLNVTAEAWTEILNDCIERILTAAPNEIFTDFNEPDFVQAFNTTWIDHLLLLLNEKVDECILSDIVGEKIEKIINHVPSIIEKISVLNSISDDLSNLNNSLSGASFKEKPELKRQISDKEEEYLRNKRARDNAIEAGYNTLLPNGVQLDDLGNIDVASRRINIRDDNATVAIYWKKHGVKVKRSKSNLDASPSTDSASIAETIPLAEIVTTAIEAEANQVEATVLLVIEEEPNAILEKVPEEAVIMAAEPETVFTDALDFSRQKSYVPVIEAVDQEEMEISTGHFVNDAREAAKRLSQFQVTKGSIPGIALENIALLWVEKNNLPMASTTLRLSEQLPVEDSCLPYYFIEAAYHGQHTWKNNQATLTRILNALNNLSTENIDEWTSRRPVGRIIPYLVFGATFQPALFAGNMTNSPRLLSSVADCFDAPITRLIEELVEFTDRNHRLDIETLTDEPKREDKDGKAKLVVAIKDWHDKIINKQTGWAPVRNAMKLCLELPEFIEVKRVIEKDDASNLESVRAFAEKYRSIDAQQELLQERITSTAREKNNGHLPIEGNARKWFTKSILDIVFIADTYVEMSAQSAQRSSDVSKFARRFMGLVSQAIQHIQTRIVSIEDLEHKAGLTLLKSILENVNGLAAGNTTSVWEPVRIQGWYSWPYNYLTSKLGIASADAEAELEEVVKLLCNEFPSLTLVDRALEKSHFNQAMLLTLELESSSKVKQTALIDKIRIAFDEAKHGCKRIIDATKVLLDNAYVASVVEIDEERHYQIGSELEHLFEQLNQLSVLESITDIQQNLDVIQLDLEKRFNTRIEEIKASLDEAVNEARVRHGADWIPTFWLAQLNLALDNHDTTIAEEMLEHLKSAIVSGDSLSIMDEANASLLNTFLAAEPTIYGKLESVSNPRDLVKEIQSLSTEGVNFSSIDQVYKTALVGLKSLKSRNDLDKDSYDFIVTILASIGLTVTTPNFNASLKEKLNFNKSDTFSSITCKVKRLASARGIVFFSEDSEEQVVNVIWVSSQWTTAELNAYIESKVHAVHDRTILLHCGLLPNLKRNEFAGFCKSHKQSIYHADLCIVTMMAGLDIADGHRFKTFLQLSLPWTYCNPYTGSAMQPAPPEMRYGRSEDIKSLTNMRNGAAIVFGGRQLGKTTLLKETQRRFNSPSQNHFAYMKQMDGNLDRATLSSNEFEKHRHSVWSTIYNFACESNMLKPVSGMTTEQMEQSLYDFFGKPGDDKLLVCLDEIDPILGLDAAHGFGIFRKLTGLVNGSYGRFKVVIAGLENVRRFADAPNYPLHQLGSAVQVSIMTPSESVQLIREPLAYMGYEFESPLLMNRILVETNRHPGLIHIFCNEIINRLSSRHNTKVATNKIGSAKITANDIDVICKDKEIRQLICDRFNITLSLDLRYQLIAYSLIGDGRPSFTPSRAKSIVEEWAPNIFGPMTEAQFEAFLDELRGLGVLQFRQRSDSGKEYSLRNANILNLVGGTQAVEDKLLRASDDIKDNDPMAGHAFNLNSERPSPLTLRDEKLLISDAGIATDETTNIVKANSSSFSVGVIVGSDALGLNTKWMEEGLISIGEEEKPMHGTQNLRYQPHVKKDAEVGGATGFKKMLSSSVDVQARRNPIMLFVEFTGALPVNEMLDLIDAANQAALAERAECHRIRIIFLVTPKALWSWVQHPELTNKREEQQTFIALGLWKNTALAHLLNKLNLSPTSTSLEQLVEFSQGWYLSINHLLTAVKQFKEKRKKIDGLTVSEFGVSYAPLLQVTGKAAESFLAKTGIMDVNWARPVLENLSKNDDFDAEDFELELLDNYSYVDPHAALKWLSLLRLVEPGKRHKGHSKPTYCVNKSVKTILLNQLLLSEIKV